MPHNSEGIVKMMYSTDNLIGPINLGNPLEITILELAAKIKDLTNSKSKFVYKPLPVNDPKRRKPSIEVAESKLNWKPKVDLEEGLERTIV